MEHEDKAWSHEEEIRPDVGVDARTKELSLFSIVPLNLSVLSRQIQNSHSREDLVKGCKND